MDWSKCLVCQENKGETIKCPLNAVSGGKTEAYATFLENISSFKNLGSLPAPLLFDEKLTVDVLVQNKAVWHKSCHVKKNWKGLEKKRERIDGGETSSSKEKRVHRQSMDKAACLFCQQSHGHLHEFSTFSADVNLRMMATELSDTALMSRIGGGDLVAIDAKYHLQCLTFYRNRYRSHLRQKEREEEGCEENLMKAKALVEVVNHIENCVEGRIFEIRLSVLFDLYQERLRDLGVDKEINRGRFTEKILEYFPYAQEQSDGKNKILVFHQGIQEMLRDTMRQDFEANTLILAKAARIIRQEIIHFTGFKFAGAFPSGCQQESVPTSLKTLVSMLMNGTDVKDQIPEDSLATLSVSQLILFNFRKHASPSKARHSLEREPVINAEHDIND